MKQPIRYRLPVAKTFPAHHPRKGEETGFWNKIWAMKYPTLSYSIHLEHLQPKIHTIRKNYDLWAGRFKKIDAGEAVLEVYEDTEEGKQNPITLSREDGIGLQELWLECWENDEGEHVYSSAKFNSDKKWHEALNLSRLAKNDGLTVDDMIDWFKLKPGKTSEPLALIHFTKFRY